ncbi:glycosyltransferase family 4 protein [Homoserinimonas sp. OAct 916]|uniref:glycosyltransferase family 4 protein n=1 Tax=Homoserinimonas sp. OAct 916 TaxID=2211450 RepID=UPI0018E5960A|nr:glycosyltransferase family 4 protein [Homoserinimonas sp. OAct 916]
MKITFIGINYAPEPTGIAPYTAGMAEGLVRTGDHVRVITGFPHYPQWRISPGYSGSSITENLAGVRIRRVRHYVPARPGLANRLLMELVFGMRAIVSRWGRADVVVMVSPALFSTALAALKARILRVRGFIWVQDIYSLGVSESGTGGKAAGRILRLIEGTTLRSASGVIVIHERFKRYLVDELGIDASKVHVVRNWSHISDPNGENRSEVRDSHGWTPHETVVLHAGNMGAKQGLENVVHASRLAAEVESPIRFVLLGDGNRRRALQDMGANSRLQFIDPLPDGEFEETLAAADILLVNERPGLTEMCVPSKLTSYFNTGLPVIVATDRSSITAEELERAAAGVRVDAAQPQDLLDAATALARNSDLSRSYGQAGRLFKEQYLSEDEAVNTFRSIIKPADD